MILSSYLYKKQERPLTRGERSVVYFKIQLRWLSKMLFYKMWILWLWPLNLFLHLLIKSESCLHNHDQSKSVILIIIRKSLLWPPNYGKEQATGLAVPFPSTILYSFLYLSFYCVCYKDICMCISVCVHLIPLEVICSSHRYFK